MKYAYDYGLAESDAVKLAAKYQQFGRSYQNKEAASPSETLVCI